MLELVKVVKNGACLLETERKWKVRQRERLEKKREVLATVGLLLKNCPNRFSYALTLPLTLMQISIVSSTCNC